jgi:hypothetical protein
MMFCLVYRQKSLNFETSIAAHSFLFWFKIC